MKIENQIAGVDVGGTFTDLISINPKNNLLSFIKVPTTANNQAHGVLNAIQKSFLELRSTDLIIHGTKI